MKKFALAFLLLTATSYGQGTTQTIEVEHEENHQPPHNVTTIPIALTVTYPAFANPYGSPYPVQITSTGVAWGSDPGNYVIANISQNGINHGQSLPATLDVYYTGVIPGSHLHYSGNLSWPMNSGGVLTYDGAIYPVRVP